MVPATRTAAANDDPRGIALQIGVESGRPVLADKIIDELNDCCDRLVSLAPMARIGTAAPQLGADVRLFSHRRWVVIFRYTNSGALILRIADGSQDYLSWAID
jgi:plasmid stabilization system protein ParE